MRLSIWATAFTIAALPFAASTTNAATDIDISGMDCAEAAVHLREVVEARENDDNAAQRLGLDITTAQAACRNGDTSAMPELVADLEARPWQLDMNAEDSAR